MRCNCYVNEIVVVLKYVTSKYKAPKLTG